MGLFKNKDKTARTDPSPTTNLAPQPPLGYNRDQDSTYYSSSNVSSNADTGSTSKTNQAPSQAQGKPPGTTVVTTTTTTTTTTTVGSDGQTHTTSAPYNPSTDPPQETTVKQIANTNPPTSSTPQPLAQSQQQPQSQTITQQQSRPNLGRRQSPARKPTPSELSGTTQTYQSPPPINNDNFDPIPGTDSTSGGRPIPPRSELRNSVSNSPSNTSPPFPERSEARTSPHIQPLSTSPNRTHNTTYTPTGAAGATGYHTAEPVSPTSPGRPPTTQNFSRPVGGAGMSTRESLTNTMKGLHGAGEAIRGTINSGIAKGLHDKKEEERMRAVREQGANEFRGSGLREGFREKAEGRMRLRRKSVEQRGIYGSEGPGGLDAVEERSIGP